MAAISGVMSPAWVSDATRRTALSMAFS
jgi:hypothetical protein